MTESQTSKPTYLDSSALMRLSESCAPNCTRRNQLISEVLTKLLNDSGRHVACSEFTLVEWHSNITKNWRGDSKDHDESWWEEAQAQLNARLADGSIEVLPTPEKAIEQVMSIVTVATRDHGRGLRAWDALHGVVASRWAFDLRSRVDIVTSDKDFSGLLEVPGMSLNLDVVNLDVLAGTGEGADSSQ